VLWDSQLAMLCCRLREEDVVLRASEVDVHVSVKPHCRSRLAWMFGQRRAGIPRCLSLREERLEIENALRLTMRRLPLEMAYDFTRSTDENYSTPHTKADPSLFSVSLFASIRNTLDQEYHGVYTAERQRIQDEIISQVAMQGITQEKPWIVFTAGAMGAGKSHVINWMSERGIFPLSNIVQLDPDVFKVALPEWKGYVAHDALSAGLHTRKESGYLVEIAQEVVMRQLKHVWIDGSLRDGEWYLRAFREIRQRHPKYKIAIIHVQAREDVVLQRVAQRAEQTGRHVPKAEVLDSLSRVPISVNLLAPEAEFLAVIDNSDDAPTLIKHCDTMSCSYSKNDWPQISMRFGYPYRETDENGQNASFSKRNYKSDRTSRRSMSKRDSRSSHASDQSSRRNLLTKSLHSLVTSDRRTTSPPNGCNAISTK